MPLPVFFLLGGLLLVNLSGFSILITTARRIAAGQARLIGLFLMHRPSMFTDGAAGEDPKVGGA